MVAGRRVYSLGIAETVRLLFLNEKWLANGSKGLYRIPKFLGDWIAPDIYNYLYLAVVIVTLAALYLAVQQAVNSPWGRVLRAIREDETAAEASGKDVFKFKLQAFIMGAMIMGIGGALYAHHIRFLSPLTFDPLLATFVIWAMLMVGGSANNKGAILGAFVVCGEGGNPGSVRGVGNLDRHAVPARHTVRSQLPTLHDRRTHRSGDPAAPRRHPRRAAPCRPTRVPSRCCWLGKANATMAQLA